MDKSRQQFEAWLVRNHSDTCNNINFEIDSKGDYRYFGTRLAWEAWQASRESLEVELPELDSHYNDYFLDGFNSAIEQVEKALISNGVKIKNE
ncbi:hypothetical protein [Providencia stuartii]|uniref:hypothetical protein n=1 Tax=Providencia stuartii TaxID=588 RepID=UPI0033281250